MAVKIERIGHCALRGRGDQDQPFSFDDPAPDWAAS